MLPQLVKLSWNECREKVRKANPKLADIIDSISPDADLAFWSINYPYGAVIDDGQFYYPSDNGKLVLLTDSKLPKNLKDDFAYAETGTPAGIVINNTIELFIEAEDQIIPHAVFMPGDVFALW